MNKQELSIVIVLFVLLFGWMTYTHKNRPPAPPPDTPPAAVEGQPDDGGPGPSTNAVTETPEHVATTNVATTHAVNTNIVAEIPAPPQVILDPEETVDLANDELQVTVSSRGGAIVGVQLKKYRQTVDDDSGLVSLDFATQPALSLEGLSGFSTNSDFALTRAEDGRTVTMTEESPGGLRLERVIALTNGYQLAVTDTFINEGDASASLPENTMSLGPMDQVKTQATVRRYMTYLGVDTFGAGEVTHWAKKGPKDDNDGLAKRFLDAESRGGCAMFKPPLTKPMPSSVVVERTEPTDWVAAKNKFFVQILTPSEPAPGYSIEAFRLVPETEDPKNPKTWRSATALKTVSAKVEQPGVVLAPGARTVRAFNYYVGPTKFDRISKLDKEQDKVMFRAWRGWGWFRGICIGMLWTLNAIYAVIPNYGVAIILLTIIVKILFWPFMHKSTESMQKMKEIQPLVEELKKKHKDNPQRMQREQMALYKEHGVNPLASCLPMFFQMPVFIALFVMLRSAVEMRFAPFLWIADLSEPEGLLQGLPLLGSLNILPVLMAATMMWQQKLTPSAGDAQQQKMMMVFMPLFMLFIMYKMPSALTLYWTVSQLLSIAQLVVQNKKRAAKAAAEGKGKKR